MTHAQSHAVPGGRLRVGIVVVALAAVAFVAPSSSWNVRAVASAAADSAARDAGTGGDASTVADTPPAAAAPACVPASLTQRAARVLIVGLPNVTSPSDPLVQQLNDLDVGGVLLTEPNVVTESQAKALIAALQPGGSDPRLITADEEPGRVRTFDGLYGYVPSARQLAATEGPKDVEAVAATTGKELAALGVTVDMAPDSDEDAGPWDGVIGDRSFSADPGAAATYALAYADGLTSAGVAPVVKHFPGHGRATEDDHVTRPVVDVSLDTLQQTDLRPFADAIAAGAPIVMMANVAYTAIDPDRPASMAPAAYQLLRSMGFQGVAITDSVGMGSVNLEWDFNQAAVTAIAAGADGVLATDGTQAQRMRDAIVAAVQSGQLPESRLDEAAGRMAALAGADPMALSCTNPHLPKLGSPSPT